MPFTAYLGTFPDYFGGTWKVDLSGNRGELFKSELESPARGRVRSYRFTIISEKYFTLTAKFYHETPGNESLGFDLHGLGSQDTLNLFFGSQFIFGGVRHRQEGKGECKAVCHDGTSGQPCVTCNSPDGTVRICC